MPKSDIDYSNTIFYKLTCKDSNVKDIYVGHTTNFVQRKYVHKQNCIHEHSTNHKCKLYEVIRENGGWSNWQMDIINVHECIDHHHAKTIEKEYYTTLNVTLNSIDPISKSKKLLPVTKRGEHIDETGFLCELCNINCISKTLLDNHNNTIDHINKKKIYDDAHERSRSVTKNADIYECKICDFKCCKQSNYEKHLLTRKHAANARGDGKNAVFECLYCKKVYSSRNGRWKHSMVCKMVNPSVNQTIVNNNLDETFNMNNKILDSSSSEIKVLTNLVLEMVKSNTEMQKQNNEIVKNNVDLQKQVIEACKNTTIQNTINNNSHNNNNNKTFNLMFFLNEQCKDAMNMSEFVESFNLQLSDLESVGNLGYVDGMTKIFVDKLNSMDVYKRPIHCSDAKREILYIKEENRWEREKPTNPKLRRAVKTITFRNMKLTNLWSDTYPESKCNESSLNDVYMKLVIQSTGGSGEISDNENKIIRRITKEIVIEKK
jgi:hypothetical protein